MVFRENLVGVVTVRGKVPQPFEPRCRVGATWSASQRGHTLRARLHRLDPNRDELACIVIVITICSPYIAPAIRQRAISTRRSPYSAA